MNSKGFPDYYFAVMECWFAEMIRFENTIAARIFRSYSQPKMNMVTFARPFFSLRAMTGRRGSRS